MDAALSSDKNTNLFFKRNGQDYMMRSEKRESGYRSKPPKRRRPLRDFLYALCTLISLVVLYPVGLVLLWRRRLRWTGVSKLLTTIVSGFAFFFFLAYILTMPIQNESLYNVQQKARMAFVNAQTAFSQKTGSWKADAGEAVRGYGENFMAAANNITPIARVAVNEAIYEGASLLRDSATEIEKIIDPNAATVWAQNGIYHTRANCADLTEGATETTLGEALAQKYEPCALCLIKPTEQPTEAPVATATPEPTEVVTDSPKATMVVTTSPTSEPARTASATAQTDNTLTPQIATAVLPSPTPTYAPPTPTPEPTPDPTPAATLKPTAKPTATPKPTAQPTVDPALLPKLKSVSDAIVWYTGDGKYYHKYSTCGSMQNAREHTLAEALAAKKRTCPYCNPISEADMAVAEPVWVTDETGLFHISDECPQLGKPWTFMSLADALKANDRPCEECGAYHYVNGIALPGKATTAPAVKATPAPTSKVADGSTIVYYAAQSKYYHLHSTCQSISFASPHTLQDAVDAGKQSCPYCHPPILP